MSNQAELSNYMQFVANIKAPGNKEDREDWDKMTAEIRESVYHLLLEENKECDCPCKRNFFDHLLDLENNPKFREHFLMLANVLQRYPELASSFTKAACIVTSVTDWQTIEDNLAAQDFPKDFPPNFKLD